MLCMLEEAQVAFFRLGFFFFHKLSNTFTLDSYTLSIFSSPLPQKRILICPFSVQKSERGWLESRSLKMSLKKYPEVFIFNFVFLN